LADQLPERRPALLELREWRNTDEASYEYQSIRPLA
jgi:hypothetical protein